MDIPVSRLNERMAVQVPAQLPLGLVFVVGKVEDLALIDEEGHPHEFYLLEADHHLRCRLTDRAAHEVGFKDGDLVRAGGHLAFEPQHADYFLLARDVEILEEFAPGRSTLSEIVAESKQQPHIAGLVAAELPTWVKQMAPPEIQEELLATAAMSEAASEMRARDSWEALEDTESSMAYPTEEPALAGLSDDLIDFLSEAMDSPEDVEVTPQLITTYRQRNSPEATQIDVVEPGTNTASAAVDVEDVTKVAPESGGRSAADVSADATVADQLTGEAAESTSSADKPVRRSRRSKQRDKVPWLMVVIAVFLFLIFLGIIVVGLFFL
jgi:hypothetical protein